MFNQKLDEKIKSIEEELRKTEKNKATEHHIGFLLAKLAKLKKEKIEREQKKSKRSGFSIRKGNEPCVFIVGPPSVGKTTLLNTLTGTNAKTADYDFTTLELNVGILSHNGFNIKIIDTPGLIKGASKGKGNGKEVLSSIRSADLLMIVVDINNFNEQIKVITNELFESGFRLNKKKPDIVIEKNNNKGLLILKNMSNIETKTIKNLLNEFGIHNANVSINEPVNLDYIIDAIIGNRVYLPAIFVINKADNINESEEEKIKKELKMKDILFISAVNKNGIDKLKDFLIQKMELIKVYTMDKLGNINKEKPLILKKGSTIKDVCTAIHRDLLKNFKYAQVWGNSVKFPGQKVGLNHLLADNDIVFIKA